MVYDPENKPVNEYARTYREFTEQTKDHTLTVILDDGLNRQMRVGAPNTGIWSWRVATWPGYLATFGDIADGFMFTRTQDMIHFFDCGGRKDYYSDGSPCIDFRYWAEKLTGGRSRDVKEYSSQSFIQMVTDDLDEHDELGTEAQETYENIVEATRRVCKHNGVDYDEYIGELRKRGDSRHVLLDIDDDDELQVDYYGEEVPEQSPAERREEILVQARHVEDNEHEAREWLRDNQAVFGQDAYWDSELRDYNVHFIYACYAIELTVRLWREYEASPEAEAHRNPGDSYILVDGGLVQNIPRIPVFNLDVLDSDAPDATAAEEALILYSRIADHAVARLDLDDVLVRAADFIRGYGDAKTVEAVEVREEIRLAAQPNELAA